MKKKKFVCAYKHNWHVSQILILFHFHAISFWVWQFHASFRNMSLSKFMFLRDRSYLEWVSCCSPYTLYFFVAGIFCNCVVLSIVLFSLCFRFFCDCSKYIYKRSNHDFIIKTRKFSYQSFAPYSSRVGKSTFEFEFIF